MTTRSAYRVVLLSDDAITGPAANVASRLGKVPMDAKKVRNRWRLWFVQGLFARALGAKGGRRELVAGAPEGSRSCYRRAPGALRIFRPI
jgi:hypothetical protein